MFCQRGRESQAWPTLHTHHHPHPPPLPTHSKHKAVHKAAGGDDKRLQSTLKRLGVTTIPGIEEVNIFAPDGVVHFPAPKVQASIGANTFVVSGPAQTRSMEEMLPSIMRQMPPDALQALAAQLGAAGGGGGGALPGADDDDDIPELVGDADETPID